MNKFMSPGESLVTQDDFATPDEAQDILSAGSAPTNGDSNFLPGILIAERRQLCRGIADCDDTARVVNGLKLTRRASSLAGLRPETGAFSPALTVPVEVCADEDSAPEMALEPQYSDLLDEHDGLENV